MKTSRSVFSEVQKKAGAFPFNVRVLDDEKRARMGLQEAVQHGLVRPYEVLYVSFTVFFLKPIIMHTFSFTPANTFVAQFHFTIALLPGGPSLISHPPVWYKPELLKTEKELEDAEIKETLSKKLRENKKNRKKKPKTDAGEANGVENEEKS
jgi:ERBB-3 binding protein